MRKLWPTERETFLDRKQLLGSSLMNEKIGTFLIGEIFGSTAKDGGQLNGKSKAIARVVRIT